MKLFDIYYVFHLQKDNFDENLYNSNNSSSGNANSNTFTKPSDKIKLHYSYPSPQFFAQEQEQKQKQNLFDDNGMENIKQNTNIGENILNSLPFSPDKVGPFCFPDEQWFNQDIAFGSAKKAKWRGWGCAL